MAMKVLWAAVLLAYGASTGAAMFSGRPGSSPPPTYSLDMASNSVDDMYDGCDVQMAERVKNEYLPNERNVYGDFKQAWDAAVVMYTEKHTSKVPWRNRNRNRNRQAPTQEEGVALYVFTSVSGNMHKPFNDAVRNQRGNYNNFRFHALHFYLTKAVQKLNKRQLEEREGKCYNVSRRTTVTFSEVEVDAMVRFGSFASSSKTKLNYSTIPMLQFGFETCFEIETCMGADVSTYSVYQGEAEILIPPYEAFTVTDVKTTSELEDLPCEVVYTLKSTRQPVSHFNCTLFTRDELQGV